MISGQGVSPSYNSVDEFAHSRDTQTLLAEGRFSVAGRNYIVRKNRRDEPAAVPESGHHQFYRAVSGLFSGSGQHDGMDREVATIFKQHYRLLLAQSAVVQADCMSRDAAVDSGWQSLLMFAGWKAHAGPDVGRIRSHGPNLAPLDHHGLTEQWALLRAVAIRYQQSLVLLLQNDSSVTSVQEFDPARHCEHKLFSTNVGLVNREKRVVPRHGVARLTINVKPQQAAALVDIMAAAMLDCADIYGAKLIALNEQGSRTESGILYLPANYRVARQVVAMLMTRLSPSVLIEHQPIGMHPMHKGIAYAEVSAADKRMLGESYSSSRDAIVQQAMADHDPLPIAAKLQKALQAHGYQPYHPAFLLGSEVPEVNERLPI